MPSLDRTSPMQSRQSLAERLRGDAVSLEDQLAAMRGRVGLVREGMYFGDLVVIAAPDYKWSALSPTQRTEQLELRRRFLAFVELLGLVLAYSPSDTLEILGSAKESVLRWIDGNSSQWELTGSSEKNEVLLRAEFRPFDRLLEALEVHERVVIVVPDTNALAENPNPRSYASIAGAERFTFGLVPSVLQELDHQKDHARVDSYREKVRRAVRMIKGWRAQGRLTEGVLVDRTITVKAFAKEPDFNRTLSWLDRDVQDDRTIASAFELQRQFPGAQVVLATRDVNLQNKAEIARLDWAECGSSDGAA